MAARINLQYVLRLRWAALGGGLLLLAWMDRGLNMNLSWTALLCLLGTGLVANLAIRLWLRGAPAVGEGHLLALMLGDVVLLTALLALSGGPYNPFSTLYLVNVALGAILLSLARARLLLVASLAAFAGLFPLQRLLASYFLLPNHGELMALHLRGMWVAFALAAAAIVFTMERVRRALEGQEHELRRVGELRRRHEKLAALGTLAAGAAHELSTPLGTIAIALREAQVLFVEGADIAAREELRVARSQVERCRTILRQMSVGAGQSVGEPIESVRMGTLIDLALQAQATETATGSSAADRVRLEVPATLAEQPLAVPRRATAQALGGLVKNALQASDPAALISIVVQARGAHLAVRVSDRGQGMSSEVLERAGEPFFTTKAPGEGMGLGLFLARSLAEQLGGGLEVESRAGEGCTATLVLPLAPVPAVRS